MCWELKLFFEYWRKSLQPSILTNGQGIREIFAVLLHLLCLSSEYICYLFFAEKVFDMTDCQSNTFCTRLAFLGHCTAKHRDLLVEEQEHLILFSGCKQQFMYCPEVCAPPVLQRVQSMWSCMQGWPPFPTALKRHCLTRLVNYIVVTDALSMNNSR